MTSYSFQANDRVIPISYCPIWNHKTQYCFRRRSFRNSSWRSANAECLSEAYLWFFYLPRQKKPNAKAIEFLGIDKPKLDKHTNTDLKVSVKVKFKNGICTELSLKLWFENELYFFNITKLGWFRKRQSKKKLLNKDFLKFDKVTIQ